MKEARVLVCGESWVIVTQHIKGFDHFTATRYGEGVEPLRKAIESCGMVVEHLPAHLAAAQFPTIKEELAQYSAVILSDIGANTLLLHPDTYMRSQPTVNRLDLLRDYVQDGGGLMMIGGYLSFTGINGKAHYKDTGVEKALPVIMHTMDDRVEVPEGFSPEPCAVSHPALCGIEGPWPTLLGYNRTELKPGATMLLKRGEHPIAAAWEYGRGRAAMFASDCAPHWGTPEFLAWPGYDLFFGQLTRWLCQGQKCCGCG